MRNVKVNVQADTTHAVNKVRELTGALSQMDAVARQSAGNALKALNGANLASLNPTHIQGQQYLAEQAQAAKVNSAKAKTPKKEDQDKLNEANKKLADKAQAAVEKQFKAFAEDLAKVFADALGALLEGGLTDGLKSLKAGLKSLLQSIMKQMISNFTDQIKVAISKKLISAFSKATSPKKDVTNNTPGNIAPGTPGTGTGTETGLPTPPPLNMAGEFERFIPGGIASIDPPNPSSVTPTMAQAMCPIPPGRSPGLLRRALPALFRCRWRRCYRGWECRWAVWPAWGRRGHRCWVRSAGYYLAVPGLSGY
jgi:hypothetical protein